MYRHYWSALPEFHLPVQYMPHTHISVLIPARNEAANIVQCLSSIAACDYPMSLFEVIVIDDHSEDETPQLVKSFSKGGLSLRLLPLKDYVKLSDNMPHKKRAIEAAIKEATGTLIVTTDADCRVPPQWLRLLAGFYELYDKRFIAAPVCFHDEQTWFERFQSLDYIGMMGVTGAGVQGHFTRMCNGANLAYEKKMFYEVGGFQGIDHVASGDDMLLMQKVARTYPQQLGFLKNIAATVVTKAQPTFKSFLMQRRRWASKSSSYTERFTIFQLVVAFLFCCSIILNFLLTLINPYFAIVFLIQFFIKTLSDFFFLKDMTRFFKRQDLMSPFIPPQLMHVFYIVTVGFMANIKKSYLWKGRRTR